MVQRLFLIFLSNELSSSDRDLLSKGLRFAIPLKQTDYSNFMTKFELLYRSTLDLPMTTKEKDHFKTKIKDTAVSSFNGNGKFENNLSAEEINLLKALMRNKNITQKADKGNIVVITDKEKYIEDVKCANSYFNKIVQLDITPDKHPNYIINVEKNFKQLFKDLLDNDKISKDQYDKNFPEGSRPGILHGNPKIHKPVVNSSPKF